MTEQDVGEVRSLSSANSVQGSLQLLKAIVKGKFNSAHPMYSLVASSLGSQGSFAALEVDFDGIRTRRLSLNTQKLAADRELKIKYAGFDALRLAAFKKVSEPNAGRAPKRGSNAWYAEELREARGQVAGGVDEVVIATAAMAQVLRVSRKYAIKFGAQKEFDDELRNVLKKFEGVGAKVVKLVHSADKE